MLFHSLPCWVDGHRPCQVTRAICHRHIRDIHFELLWVTGLEDQSRPQTIPRSCRNRWGSPTHANRLTTRLGKRWGLAGFQALGCCRCLIEHIGADGAWSLPIKAHLVLGMATEHLEPERILSQSEHSLLLCFHTVDNRACPSSTGPVRQNSLPW